MSMKYEFIFNEVQINVKISFINVTVFRKLVT